MFSNCTFLDNSIYTNYANTQVYWDSAVDIFAKANLDISLLGHCFLWYNDNGTNIRLEDQDDIYNHLHGNYIGAEVYINTDTVKAISLDKDKAEATIAHEIGHALGLNENKTRYDLIMQPSYTFRTVIRPTSEDASGLTYLYK